MSGRRVNEALSHEASKRFFSCKADDPLTDPPECLGWARADWDTLSPGSKREIERDLRKRGLIEDLCSPPPECQSLKDRKAEVEYAGKKRL